MNDSQKPNSQDTPEAVSLRSGERIWLKQDQNAVLKDIGLSVTNQGVMKLILNRPFDEYYEVWLQFRFQSDDEIVELSLKGRHYSALCGAERGSKDGEAVDQKGCERARQDQE